jgi:predicted transcriptional regulator
LFCAQFAFEGTMSDYAKSSSRSESVALTAEIVAAYLSNNVMPVSEIPLLIQQVHAALLRLTGAAGENGLDAPRPAGSPKRSMSDEYIVCLEDGKRFKTLKRHLRTQYKMTPEQYREKWSLPADNRW